MLLLFFQLTVKVIGLKYILLHQYRLSTHPEQLVQISALISPSAFFFFFVIYLFVLPISACLHLCFPAAAVRMWSKTPGCMRGSCFIQTKAAEKC